MMQVRFRFKGHKGVISYIHDVVPPNAITAAGFGTLYFNSVRKAKGEPFNICMLKLFQFVDDSF